jgi:hypothetical protein
MLGVTLLWQFVVDLLVDGDHPEIVTRESLEIAEAVEACIRAVVATVL